MHAEIVEPHDDCLESVFVRGSILIRDSSSMDVNHGNVPGRLMHCTFDCSLSVLDRPQLWLDCTRPARVQLAAIIEYSDKTRVTGKSLCSG